MDVAACRRGFLAAAIIASGAYAVTAGAKTIALSCPVRTNSAPFIYYIDLAAAKVSATWNGSKFIDGNDATITDDTISFIYDAYLGNRGTCRDQIVIDRHTAGITSTPLDSDGCGDQYWSVQCALVPDNSF